MGGGQDARLERSAPRDRKLCRYPPPPRTSRSAEREGIRGSSAVSGVESPGDGFISAQSTFNQLVPMDASPRIYDRMLAFYAAYARRRGCDLSCVPKPHGFWLVRVIMASAAPKLLVVGGNGFLGSAICKMAVVAGWDVSSMSSSGKPYTTPAGHTPPWVHQVSWHRASAFEPDQYRDLLSDRTAVVHSLGILLEDAGYKQAIKDGNIFRVAKAVGSSLFGGPAPLRGKEEMRRGYEGMNRDSALTVLDTYLSQSSALSAPTAQSSTPTGSPPTPERAFVYISAADAFRPLIPARYLETKREAEAGIDLRCAQHPEAGVRGIYMRPGLMYHPHTRPLSTLPSFLLSCTASLHDSLGANQLPLSPSNPIGQAARALQTHPLHVDHVASAVLKSIVEGRKGVVDVPAMRRWAGFKVRGEDVIVDESVKI